MLDAGYTTSLDSANDRFIAIFVNMLIN